jgi:3-deoxy-D-manno-octulosonic-acid transferase
MGTLGKVGLQGNPDFVLFKAGGWRKLVKLMAMLLYRVLYLPGLLLLLPWYLWRMWRRGGYGQGLSNRFGLLGGVPPKAPGCRRIWIQAVSVGELLAVEPLIRELTADSGIEIVLTTTTSTGYRLLQERFGSTTVWRGAFPMDFVAFSGRAWRTLQPDLAVLMEGELWPEHIHQAWKRGVPAVLVNARLSDRSFRRHMRMRRLVRAYFRKLSGILTGSETDLGRFRELAWLPGQRVAFTGNLKLDLEAPPPITGQERRLGFEEFGFGDGEEDPDRVRVLLGSSTWPGEEALLADAYLALREGCPGLRLLLVPRHAERKKAIEAELRGRPLRCHFRTDGRRPPAGTQVYVADTTGELKQLTRLADLVFIGKSLPPNRGGQTPIEAAALGKPLILGPDMSNFRDISAQLVREGGARQLDDPAQLVGVIRALLLSPAECAAMGRRAGACIAASRGATRRTREQLEQLLNRTGQTRV